MVYRDAVLQSREQYKEKKAVSNKPNIPDLVEILASFEEYQFDAEGKLALTCQH